MVSHEIGIDDAEVAYDKFEYALEVNFEQLNFTTYDHMWVG